VVLRVRQSELAARDVDVWAVSAMSAICASLSCADLAFSGACFTSFASCANAGEAARAAASASGILTGNLRVDGAIRAFRSESLPAKRSPPTGRSALQSVRCGLGAVQVQCPPLRSQIA